MAKYIEKDFPIGILSKLAEQESWRKEVYRPVYYLHKWWAKRLGSIFRGIILGACEEEDINFLDAYYACSDFSQIKLFDPFMGSGVTVGEAAKLGCQVIGRDINPVAFTIVQASFSSYDLDQVEVAFQKIKANVKQRIQNFYQAKLSNGKIVDVLYYFWVKILACPSCQTEIELFKTRIFSKNAVSKKDSSAHSICPRCSSINETYFDSKEVFCSQCRHTYNPQIGNAKGGEICCPYCFDNFKLTRYLAQRNEPLPHKLYAKMVLHPDGRKSYEPVNNYDNELFDKAQKEYLKIKHEIPVVSIERGYNTNQVLKYNYSSWNQMFLLRQLLCISYLVKEIQNISDQALKRLFACLLSGVLEFNNLFCSFKGEGTGAVRHMFSHHVLKPELMPIEANIWGTPKSSGSFSTLYKTRILRALEYKANPFELYMEDGKFRKVRNISKSLNFNITSDYLSFKRSTDSIYLSYGDSSQTDINSGEIDIVVTDPPFFDNVHYSQLADFFYYWLNQILEISTTQTTRSYAEVQDTNAQAFTKKLCRVFQECHRVLKSNGLFIFTYHHSKHEGWISVYNAIRKAGFECIQAFPIKAEMSVSRPLQQAKTPIHLDLILVCRKSENKESSTLKVEEIRQQSLKKTKNQINELSQAGIAISLGDAKVSFMGRLLCHLSQMNNLAQELKILTQMEAESDEILSELLQASESSKAYKIEREIEQLTLFETEKYFKKLEATVVAKP